MITLSDIIECKLILDKNDVPKQGRILRVTEDEMYEIQSWSYLPVLSLFGFWLEVKESEE